MNDRPLDTDPEAGAVLDDLVRAARADRPGSGSMQHALVALGLGAGVAHVSAAAGAAGAAAQTASGAATTAAVSATAAAAMGGKTAAVGLSAFSIVKATAVGIVASGVVLGTAATTGLVSLGRRAQPADVAVGAPAQDRGRVLDAVPNSGEPAANRAETARQDDERPTAAPANRAGEARGARQQASASSKTASASVDEPQSAAEERAPAGETPLAGEVRLLEAAKSEISAGRPGGAVDILDRYRRAYPDGRLALEADVLRIEALFKSGRAATAMGLANKFLAANPHSPLSSRVRAMLREEPPR